MANTVEEPTPRMSGGGLARPEYGLYRLPVSRYEQVASMLLALVIVIGVLVAILLIIWLTNQIFSGQAAIPVVMEDIGTGEGQLGEGSELAVPDEEVQEYEPQDTLAVVADAVASKFAMLDNPRFGSGSGSGGGGGKKGKPRRWEVRFAKGNTLSNYAKQLDFFGVELGVLMPGNKVAYVRNLSATRPEKRVGPRDAEKRYYLTWRRGDLQQADRDLLARAGVSSEGKLILKFLTP